MKKWFHVLLLAFCIAMLPGLSTAQPNASSSRTIDATVSTIDTVGSIIVLVIGNDTIRFTVAQNAKIQRGTDDIFLDDIDQGDAVTVKYYVAPDGTNVITSISDSNLANEF